MNLLHCTNVCRATRASTRRQHLLDVARRLFTEHGFHATGVAQIASESGIKVGQIYRDFQSKDDIIAALVEADLAEFLEEDSLTQAVERDDFAAVRGWIGRFIDVREPIEECRLMAEINAEAGRNPRIAELQHAVNARIRANLTRALVALEPDESRARCRALLVDLILTLGTGLMVQRLSVPGLAAEALAAHMGRLIDREIAGLKGCDALPVAAE